LVTTDRGIPQQQSLSRFDLAVVVLEAKSNSYEDFPSLMDRTNCRFLARTTAGSARTLHQPDKMRFEETHAPFPIEHLTTLTTYLTTYPRVSMGFREGRSSYPRAGISFLRGFMGVPGGLRVPT
jgi:hypothetical protein